MNCVGHIQHGMWTHPRDRSTEYNTIRYRQDLARLAERGRFDGIFLADIVGVYDVYRGGPAPSIVDAVQIPVNDPMMVVPVMAAVTEHIGFGVTANLTYEPPYLFARRMSTLDHLTGGRVGWNIVTGYLDSAARGMGLTAQPDHDGRYDAADEYMSVVYKLWEASWEDGAVRRDKKNRIFADPTKIHRVRHHGPRYQVDAIHLSEPSLQRTPVLYQAGSSSRGRGFAATHAECVFVFGADKRITRDLVADIRSRATAHGRDPKDILIFYNLGRMRRTAHADHPPSRHPRHFLEKRGVGPAGFAKARRRRMMRAVGFGFDRPRGHAIDRDAVAHDLAGQGDGQPDHRPLANAGEQRVVRRAGPPRLATDIDDAAIAALRHMRQHALQQRSVFQTFQRTAFCVSSSVKSTRCRRISAAALLTSVSICPYVPRACSTMASATPGSLKSPPTARNGMSVSSRNSPAAVASRSS
jgi:alkanesulfonate monooxygenase SsuD/methylene tetrahydromethanopterin reductase-like flavin-dependent oxidoreductase (luciferase family)